MRRRLLVFPFARTFEPHEIKSSLFDQIWEKEASGILNHTVAGFSRLKKRGAFKEPQDCLVAKQEWIVRSNILTTFIDEECELGEDHKVFSGSRGVWPIPKDDNEAVAFIKAHFFAKEKRQVERDNAISRLWWMAYLCSRVPSLEIEEALEAFLFRADVRASIIERPSTSQSISLFGALLKKLSESYKGGQKLFVRETFRDMMIEINSIGGSKLLDYLDVEQAENVLDGIIKHRLQLASI